MKLFVTARLLCAAALAFGAHTAHAIGIVDPSGDFLTTFSGTKGPDLDVVGGFVTYNQSTDTFLFAGVLNGDVGTTASGFYIFGVDRGGGTPGFHANDPSLDAIKFDSIVRLNPNGTGSVTTFGPGGASTTLGLGSVLVAGDAIFGKVSGSLLFSTGAAKADYTWNLWPRDSNATGIAFDQIADFAPNTANAHVVVIGSVPEPATVSMLGLGLGVVALGALRRRSRA